MNESQQGYLLQESGKKHGNLDDVSKDEEKWTELELESKDRIYRGLGYIGQRKSRSRD
jgi:hypothetical protein